MKYCRFLLGNQVHYGSVEERNGELWITGPAPAPEEDLAFRLALDKTDADSSLTATLTFDFDEEHLAASSTNYDLLYSATDPFVFHSLGQATLLGDQVSFTLAPARLQDGYYTLGRAIRGTMICVQ